MTLKEELQAIYAQFGENMVRLEILQAQINKLKQRIAEILNDPGLNVSEPKKD